jgi:hypothetical protein
MAKTSQKLLVDAVKQCMHAPCLTMLCLFTLLCLCLCFLDAEETSKMERLIGTWGV